MASFLDGALAKGYQALSSLACHPDFSQELVDGILGPKGADRAMGALRREFSPPPPPPFGGENSLWRSVSETVMEVDLDAPHVLPFWYQIPGKRGDNPVSGFYCEPERHEMVLAWKKPVPGGKVTLELKGEKVYQDGAEIQLFCNPVRAVAGEREPRKGPYSWAWLKDKTFVHANVFHAITRNRAFALGAAKGLCGAICLSEGYRPFGGREVLEEDTRALDLSLRYCREVDRSFLSLDLVNLEWVLTYNHTKVAVLAR